MTRRCISITFLLVALIIQLSACGMQSGQSDQKNPVREKVTQTVNIDSAALTKDATWDAYQKVLLEVKNGTFPIEPMAAKRIIGDKQDTVMIVDMRSPADYKKKHVKGAINLSINELADNIDRFSKDITLVLYCYTGQTSALAMVPLKAYGINAIFVDGGFGKIEQAGFEMGEAVAAFKPGPTVQESNTNRAVALAGIKSNFAAIARQHAVRTLVILDRDVAELVEGMPTKYAFVDLRPKEEYDKAHIKGAVNAPLMELRQQISRLPKDRRLILCCKSGQLASMATAPLTAEGFKIISLCSGFDAAEISKFPMEKKVNNRLTP